MRANVGGEIGVVQAEFAFITVANDLLEEGFERMRLGLHTHLPSGAQNNRLRKRSGCARAAGFALCSRCCSLRAARESASVGPIYIIVTLSLSEELRLARGEPTLLAVARADCELRRNLMAAAMGCRADAGTN